MPRKSISNEALESAERAIVEGVQKSKQPRFDKKQSDIFVGNIRWMKDAFEHIPEYDSDSRLRSKWLNQFWHNEPYLGGVINSVVQIDRNRGWTLVGGRNQVLRFTDVLHNWQVQPGRASWRDGVGAMAQAFYTMDIGGIVEVGRQMKRGPMSALFHLDPTRCALAAGHEYPLKYYPAKMTIEGRRMVELSPSDYMRCVSQVNVDEQFNGLGYSPLSRCIELAVTMVAVVRHNQELLFARAPKGLLLLKGVTQKSWNDAMASRDATLEGREQEWFGAVAVLATTGMDDVDAKLVALSQLPEKFDQKVFTDLLIYGYALAFGYDAREFWPVNASSLIGTARESEIQHRKATGKGGKEFALALTEELQSNMPETLHFEFEERDIEGERRDAEVEQIKIDAVNAMRGTTAGALISDEQALSLLAEKGVLPREWTKAIEDVEATDIEDADSPESDADEDVAEDEPDEEDTDTDTEAERWLETPEVLRAMARYPDEPIVKYSYPANRVRELSLRKRRTYSIPHKTRADDTVLHQGATPEETITEADVEEAIAVARHRLPELYQMVIAEELPEEERSRKGLFQRIIGRLSNGG